MLSTGSAIWAHDGVVHNLAARGVVARVYSGMRTLEEFHGEPAAIAARQCGYLTTSQCRRLGLDHRYCARRAADGRWRRAGPAIWDTAPHRNRTIAEEERRAVELALLCAGSAGDDRLEARGATAVGLAALCLHGCWALPRRWRALAVRGSRRQSPGCAQHDRFAVVLVKGRRAASIPWAILQALPRLDRLHLVAVLDWALGIGAIRSVEDLVRLGRGRRGVARLREWGHLADGRSGSLLETWARLQCTDHGLPPDTLQLEIRDDSGRIVALGDLAWRLDERRWLVVEIDGASIHDRAPSIRADRRRQNTVVGLGEVTILRYDAEDLLREGYVPRDIAQHRRRLSRAPA